MEIHLLFILFISAGLALGIYGVVIQQGANLVRMDVRTLAMGLAWGAIQLCASLIGYGTGRWILNFEMGREHSSFWANLLAGLILAGIGVRMLMKALQKKTFLEHRMEQLDIRQDFLLALRMCVHGLFAGIACGLLQYSLPILLICAFVISVISALGGYISGQIWGAEPCSRAFGIGGILLFLTGIALQLVQFG
jgi:putative Mn2+ efflux pump MntP